MGAQFLPLMQHTLSDTHGVEFDLRMSSSSRYSLGGSRVAREAAGTNFPGVYSGSSNKASRRRAY